MIFESSITLDGGDDALRIGIRQARLGPGATRFLRRGEILAPAKYYEFLIIPGVVMILDAPGGRGWQCEEQKVCVHFECELRRVLAELICLICLEPVRYSRRFERYGDGVAHTFCAYHSRVGTTIKQMNDQITRAKALDGDDS